MAYLLDANCFIQAKNREYAFDFCPAYWDWIVREHASGKVLSVERVGDELAAGNDDLTAWASMLPATFFAKPDARTLSSLAGLSAWATGANHDAAAVSDFFNAADYFLIGHAMAYGHIVVTHEQAVAAKRKIKIPIACQRWSQIYDAVSNVAP